MNEQELELLKDIFISKMDVFISILISIVAVGITIINFLNNIRWLKLKNTFDLLEAFYHELTAETIPDELRLISDSWQSGEKAEAYFKKHKQDIYDVFNKFEIFSLKIKQRYIRRHIVKNFYLKLIVDYYEKVFCVYIKYMNTPENSEQNLDKQSTDNKSEYNIIHRNFTNLFKKEYSIYQNTIHMCEKWSKYYKC